MVSLNDFQIIGLRTFGQVWATDASTSVVQTFAGACQENSASLTVDNSIAEANKLTPTSPPGGWGGAGYGDLVKWRPGNPAGAAGAPVQNPQVILASIVLALHWEERDETLWLLTTIDDQKFVLASLDEVTLVESAP